MSSTLDIIYMTYQHNDGTESADKPVQEIEITPEMIEAGVYALASADPDWRPSTIVVAVFESMLAAVREGWCQTNR